MPASRLKNYSDDPTKTTRLSASFNVISEKISSWRDFLRLHCCPLEDYMQEWPCNPPSFRYQRSGVKSARINIRKSAKSVIHLLCFLDHSSDDTPARYFSSCEIIGSCDCCIYIHLITMQQESHRVYAHTCAYLPMSKGNAGSSRGYSDWCSEKLTMKTSEIESNSVEDEEASHVISIWDAIQPLEQQARECYSQIIHLDSDEFIEMMVVDGSFIIELFRKVGNVVEFEDDDPIVTMAWIIPFFYRDLLRLENQIPFFVLECLFDITRMPGEESGPSLCKLALDFFNYALQRPDHIIARHTNLKARHLLDLIRSSFIDFEQGQPLSVDTSTPVIHSVSKLRRAGIELSQGNPEDSFLVVRFENGVIEMPTITIDETVTSFLLNCVAFEQCHNGSSKHFTTYATLLDCLVNTFKDVEHLCDRNIIENYFGTDSEVASFINDLGKEVAFDIESIGRLDHPPSNGGSNLLHRLRHLQKLNPLLSIWWVIGRSPPNIPGDVLA
ncbi:hypothetical protein SADUNF_Sadunf05G0086000 [Salix dunnii]|uniref:Uncharacterized protein n=1 Tax=Salix dunnii TaxID=1413687 RepID=A0A835MYT8_9ROSI|nr:hypothetical protein SADUNF_Sadunf05G0086000 [Salix dunnii]